MDTKSTHRYPRDLGVLAKEKQVLLYSNLSVEGLHPFHAGVSQDGLHFKKTPDSPSIVNEKGAQRNTVFTDTYRASRLNGRFILFYKSYGHTGEASLAIADSKDGISWKSVSEVVPFKGTAMLAPEYSYNGQHVVYYGDTEIRVAYTKDFESWTTPHEPVLSPRHSYFDNHPVEVGSVFQTEKGIVVIYFVRTNTRGGNSYMVGAALFDKDDPTREIWRSSTPFWEQHEEWSGNNVYPMGAVHFKEQVILYFGIEGVGVHAVCLENLEDLLKGRGVDAVPRLERSTSNPIIVPVLKHMWEATAVFNSAAVYEGGKVHFVYRAMGPHNTSVLGYATSSDGETIDHRETEPIYVPTEWFEVPGRYPSVHFMSGGGYGGCEDPRITKVDDTFYMTYVAYNGEDPPRVALTSIKVDDFMNKRWKKWAKPKLISKPGVVNKNCVIFPEKIGDKYVVIHRVFPDLLIDFVDDLTFEKEYLKGEHKIPPRGHSWDSRKLGAGAPPIKTDDGWLLIYQAVDDRDPSKYKIGAMLLDLKDPSKVLYRCNNPILEPTEWYENEGFKAGVAYPCGAVIMNGKLVVYYGGADTVICAAYAPLDKFLKELKESSPAKAPEKVLPRKIDHFSYAHAQ